MKNEGHKDTEEGRMAGKYCEVTVRRPGGDCLSYRAIERKMKGQD